MKLGPVGTIGHELEQAPGEPAGVPHPSSIEAGGQRAPLAIVEQVLCPRLTQVGVDGQHHLWVGVCVCVRLR